LVEFHNGEYTVPYHPDEFHPSYYDYFSYPIGICDNPESLLLAATDCIYPWTYMSKSLADRSYLDRSYLPINMDDIREIYTNHSKLVSYISRREPNSILYGPNKKDLNNYVVRETIDDLKVNMDGGELDVCVLDNPKIKDLSVIEVMKLHSILVCLMKDLNPEKLLKIVNEFDTVNLFVFKMCSPLIVVRAVNRKTSNNDIEVVKSWINDFKAYVASLITPAGITPQNIYSIMLNL